ncbi:MAG: hypothetical protein WB239_14630, partial [Acidimicrobiia bacterium]
RQSQCQSAAVEKCDRELHCVRSLDPRRSKEDAASFEGHGGCGDRFSRTIRHLSITGEIA